MGKLFRFAVALAAGAVAMYYFDPQRGRRRRALVRDRGVAARHEVERLARAKARRAVDHLHGVVARTRAHIANAPVDDDRLRERVRSQLGHVVARPSGIDVQVRDGRVVLSGVAASREEIDALVHTVATLPGVGEVDNLLAPDYSTHAEVLGPQH